MKTSVSIPDDLFQAAEKIAERLSLSRSELYARAIAAYVDARGGDDVTERLNRLYPDGSSSVESVLAALQATTLDADDW